MPESPRNKNSPFTIGEAMERLLPRLVNESDRAMPLWPPDLFCLLATVLQLSGAYSLIVHEDYAPKQPWERQKVLRRIAEAWAELIRKWQGEDESVPLELKEPLVSKSDGSSDFEILRSWWDLVLKNYALPLEDLLKAPKGGPDSDGMESTSSLSFEELECLMDSLFGLLAASDEMSSMLEFGFTAERVTYEHLAWRQLALTTSPSARGNRGTLCRDIDATRAVVLPKVHTPRNGLTLRNLSNHLAYLRVSDVRPKWVQFFWGTDRRPSELNEHVNLLVIPWPSKVNPAQFRPIASVPVSEEDGRSRSPRYGLFTYDPSVGPGWDDIVELCRRAEAAGGPVHGLVFPETAMSSWDYEALATGFFEDGRREVGSFLVAGVGKRPPDLGGEGSRFPENRLRPGGNQAVIECVQGIQERKIRVKYEQGKHHRWKIDGPQIVQYGLGGRLHPNLDWWEFIRSGDRAVGFVELRPWLTTSVLVCEDLARPDPVGEALRAVGPNLIISLLLDGPQLQGRWPGRYATALADDPGSSVLTVTSLGMARLSCPGTGFEPRSECIALWKDAKRGVRELNLPAGADALLLTLSPDHIPEYSADGRKKEPTPRSTFPILTGVLPISLHH
jgi:hypothetical protein